MRRYIDEDVIIQEAHRQRKTIVSVAFIEDMPTADVVEVGKWCDMHEYNLEIQVDENGHNEFFRIIKLPVITFNEDEVRH